MLGNGPVGRLLNLGELNNYRYDRYLRFILHDGDEMYISR